MVIYDNCGPAEYVERRAAPRRTTTLRLKMQDGSVERYTQFVDLSAGGARIRAAKPPAVGTNLKLSFQLHPGADPLEVKAKIVWRRQGYYGRNGLIGVVFTSISDIEGILEFLGQR